MKTRFFLCMAACSVLCIAGCKSGQNNQTDPSSAPGTEVTAQAPEAVAAESSSYNPTDARTFGVVGPVKEIRLSKALLSTTSTEEQGDPWLESNALEMTFDENGRVTLDGLAGCKYVYDENGNFIKGFSDKTVMVRDDNGRIISYANTNIEGIDDYSKINFEEYIGKSFEYDELGRVVKAVFSGWEWETTYTYEYFGGNVYPSKATYEGAAESETITGTITFVYDQYDGYGNWTERTVIWEEERRQYGDDEVEKSKDEYLERRTIQYYSD